MGFKSHFKGVAKMEKANGDNGVKREDPCGVSPCDDLQSRILIEEYRQWSADWRLRDEYVERKFLSAAFYITVFLGLIGWFVSSFRNIGGGSESSGSPLWSSTFPGIALLVLFLILAGYTLFMLISLVKDVSYRDGTRQMIIRVLRELEDEFKVSTSLNLIEEEEKYLTISIPPYLREKGLVFPRKVAVHSHLVSSWVFRYIHMKISTFELFVVFHILILLLGCAGVGMSIWYLVR